MYSSGPPRVHFIGFLIIDSFEEANCSRVRARGHTIIWGVWRDSACRPQAGGATTWGTKHIGGGKYLHSAAPLPCREIGYGMNSALGFVSGYRLSSTVLGFSRFGEAEGMSQIFRIVR